MHLAVLIPFLKRNFCLEGLLISWFPRDWFQINTQLLTYCWWLKSGDHQLRLVVYPIIFRVSKTSQVDGPWLKQFLKLSQGSSRWKVLEALYSDQRQIHREWPGTFLFPRSFDKWWFSLREFSRMVNQRWIWVVRAMISSWNNPNNFHCPWFLCLTQPSWTLR